MTEDSSRVLVDSVSGPGIRLLSYEINIPSTFYAELLSNKGISVTAAGGNIHKPMTMVRAIATATVDQWHLFFAKYSNPTSPMHMQRMAGIMRAHTDFHVPTPRKPGTWHLPYIDKGTVEDAICLALEAAPPVGLTLEQLDLATTAICVKLSVIRCHSVSLLTPPFPASRARHQERMQFYKDLLAVHGQLLSGYPLGSAFEHQAEPDVLAEPSADWGRAAGWAYPSFHGNLRGWKQHRMMFIEPLLVSLYDFNLKEQANGCSDDDDRGRSEGRADAGAGSVQD